jgi:hypothetical protein
MTKPAPVAATTSSIANKINSAKPADVGLSVFVIGPDAQGTPTAHRVKLGPAAGAEILDAARDYIAKVDRRTRLAYGPAIAVPAGHSLELDASRAVNLIATEASMTSGSTDDFNPKAVYARRINLMAVRLTLADASAVTLYRVLIPLFRFGRGSLISLVQQDGQYNRLDPQELLMFDLNFDVLVAAGTAVFDKKSTFERAFGFLDELKKNSKKAFKRVTKGLKIKGLADLEAACTSEIPMMNKMASITRSIDDDPDYAKAMTMTKLVTFIKANSGCGVELEGQGASTVLVYDNSPQRRFKILNLLDDDFLHSDLTQREYEASSKSRAGT